MTTPKTPVSRKQLSLDLLEQLSFYGAYHSNRWNQLVHLIFVPMIVFTALVWLSYTPSLINLSTQHWPVPDFVRENFAFNGAFLFFVAYATFYVLLEPVAGLSFNCIMFAMVLYANKWVQVDPVHAWQYATVLHLASWFFQVAIGHQVFEGRAPSLLDSFLQSLVMSPLFVWFEVLFFFGYCPTLYKDMKNRVALNMVEYNKEKRAKQK